LSYLMVPWMILAFLRLGQTDVPPAERLLCLAGLAAGVTLYDMFPLVAAGVAYLLLKRRWWMAGAATAVQVLVPLVFGWLLRNVLGTEGNLDNAKLMSAGVHQWFDAAQHGHIGQLAAWLRVAVMNVGWALLFVPALLILVHMGWRAWAVRREPAARWEPALPLLFLGATIGAYWVLAPGMAHFSGNGLLPRISYYPWLFGLYATCWACERVHPRLTWVYPVVLLAMAQWDFITGSQWLARAFTFGG
jgi:hypothetical protein